MPLSKSAKSTLRVILSLLAGFFLGVKAPEGMILVCTIAQTFEIPVQACFNGSM